MLMGFLPISVRFVSKLRMGPRAAHYSMEEPLMVTQAKAQDVDEEARGLAGAAAAGGETSQHL